MRVATLGDINVDVVLNVNRLPHRGEEVFASQRRELLGGSAVNTAVALRRLGQESTVMGSVGDDDAGRRALALLHSAGVATDLTKRSPTSPTAMNTILVIPDGERTMVGSRGANVTYGPSRGWETDLDWLHLSGYALMEGQQKETALMALETARAADLPLSLDVPTGVGERISSITSNLARLPDIVVGSHKALSALVDSENPVDSLLDSGVSLVAVTSGASPFMLISASARQSLTPPHVEAVDTTGAGDAFVAGLIAARTQGFSPGTTAVLAAAAGAAATLVTGALDTLAEPTTFTDLLNPEVWPDAHPDWIEEVRQWFEAL